MNKPKTIEEFKTLILNMDHRERFVFYTELDKWLEVYSTTVKGGNMNYKFSFWNDDSKPVNKIKKYVSDDYINKLYNLIE